MEKQKNYVEKKKFKLLLIDCIELNHETKYSKKRRIFNSFVEFYVLAFFQFLMINCFEFVTTLSGVDKKSSTLIMTIAIIKACIYIVTTVFMCFRILYRMKKNGVSISDLVEREKNMFNIGKVGWKYIIFLLLAIIFTLIIDYLCFAIVPETLNFEGVKLGYFSAIYTLNSFYGICRIVYTGLFIFGLLPALFFEELTNVENKKWYEQIIVRKTAFVFVIIMLFGNALPAFNWMPQFSNIIILLLAIGAYRINCSLFQPILVGIISKFSDWLLIMIIILGE